MNALFRLIRDGVIVGYEEHKKDKTTGLYYIYNTAIYKDYPTVSGTYCTQIIPHDRKDMYTGIEIDKVKLFHRDRLEHKEEIIYKFKKDGGAYFGIKKQIVLKSTCIFKNGCFISILTTPYTEKYIGSAPEWQRSKTIIKERTVCEQKFNLYNLYNYKHHKTKIIGIEEIKQSEVEGE